MKRFDYHTHNGYSGCASGKPYTVKEGWSVLQKRGVTKYGVSNHFPTRPIYGDYLPHLREEIDALENENILLGVELELDDERGINKLSKQQGDLLDFIIGSAHRQPSGFLLLPDLEPEEIEEYFESFKMTLVNGFNNIPIKIWGHPFLQEFQKFGDKYWKDYMRPLYLECLDVCAERQIAIELTPAYDRKCQEQPSIFRVLDDMYTLAMENKEVFFATNSDAHNLDRLGDLTIPFEYVKKLNIPESRILDLKKKE